MTVVSTDSFPAKGHCSPLVGASSACARGRSGLGTRAVSRLYGAISSAEIVAPKATRSKNPTKATLRRRSRAARPMLSSAHSQPLHGHVRGLRPCERDHASHCDARCDDLRLRMRDVRYIRPDFEFAKGSFSEMCLYNDLSLKAASRTCSCEYLGRLSCSSGAPRARFP
jgi:hypothetical protein